MTLLPISLEQFDQTMRDTLMQALDADPDLGPDDDPEPMMVLRGPSQSAIVMLGGIERAPDDAAMFLVSKAVYETQATMFALAWTAWAAPADDGVLPSQHPEREEMMTLTTGDATTVHGFIATLERQPDRGPLIGKLEQLQDFRMTPEEDGKMVRIAAMTQVTLGALALVNEMAADGELDDLM